MKFSILQPIRYGNEQLARFVPGTTLIKHNNFYYFEAHGTFIQNSHANICQIYRICCLLLKTTFCVSQAQKKTHNKINMPELMNILGRHFVRFICVHKNENLDVQLMCFALNLWHFFYRQPLWSFSWARLMLSFHFIVIAS